MSSADRIADTILRIGEIQGRGLTDAANIRARSAEIAADANARATAANGQIWGQTLSQLGQLPGQVIGQIQQQKTQNIQNQQQQLLLKRAQDWQTGQEAYTRIAANLPSNPDGTKDLTKIDQFAGADKLQPDQRQALIQQASELNQHIVGAKNDKLNRLGDVANMLQGYAKTSGQPITLPTLGLVSKALTDAGIVTDDETQQIAKHLVAGADPMSVLEAIKMQAPKYAKDSTPIDVAPGHSLVDRNTMRPTFTATEEPGKGDYTINGQRFGANGQPKGPAVPPQATATPPSIEQKSVLVDGKPTLVNFNSKTGQSLLPGTNEDVSARVKPMPAASAQGAAPTGTDPKDIADAIARGEQPPTLTGLYRNAGPVRAELARMGYDLSTAQTDWAATQKHVATLNGAQQTRLNQSVNALPDLLDSVDALATQWKAGRFPLLNKANLALAKNGAFGKDAASIANQLDSQISDVVADLGNVYMGGNSPTDHALELAGKSLNANWDQTVLSDMVKLAKKNVQIRQNSIRNTGVQGASAGNTYGGQAPGATPQADPLGIR